MDVLCQCIDLLPSWIFSNEAVVVNGEDVFLLGDKESEASTSGILEGNATGLRAKDPIDIVTIVEFVIESFRYMDLLRWISILDDDQMVWLEERSPLLEEIEVSDGGYDDIQLVNQRRLDDGCRDGHGGDRRWLISVNFGD